jgi:hypothetical protein
MALGAGRLAGGGNQNKLGLNRLFPRRGRRLREIISWRGVSNCLLLKVRGLLESGVVGSDLESIAVTQARSGLLG